MKPVIWMFSGQGSQYYQMGKDLYEKEPVFRRAMDSCSELLHPHLKVSLAQIIYEARDDRFAPFDRILHTNPAISIVQYSVAQMLLARGFRPDYILGYSMGEITGNMVAGVISLSDGLSIVIKLAELLERSVAEGGMLAILKEPEIIERRPEAFQGTWLAAHNFPAHFVVSGDTMTLSRVGKELTAATVTTQQLPVRYAFHSPLIDAVKQEFMDYVGAFCPSRPAMNVISSVDGSLAKRMTPNSMWEMIRQPIEFKKTIDKLERQDSYVYVDMGPSGTLASFVKYNLNPLSQSKIVATVTPFGRAVENIAALDRT